jgi:WD40 repeat protein
VTKRIFAPDPIQSVHYCREARAVLTGADSGRVRGACRLQLHTAPDSHHLCTQVFVWDVETCKRKQTMELHKDWVSTMCEIPFAAIVAFGSLDGDMTLWDIATGATSEEQGGISAL